MNLEGDRLCPNEPDIASKIMEGEALLINLRNGAYYSLAGTGAWVWHALRGHRTQAEVVDFVAMGLDVDPTTARRDVASLLAELAQEDLVRASGLAAPAAPVDPPPPVPEGGYSSPRLEKFSDMQDLLALDPPTPGLLDNLMRQPGDDSDG